jgi:hypothetical protein
MMALQVDNKTGLLLSPQQLLKNSSILQTLHVRKTAADVKYETIDLDSREINRTYSQLPKDVKELLIYFSVGHGDIRSNNIRSRYKTGRAGIAFNEFYDQALLRDLHGLFERLKPFAALFKWYHKIWQNKLSAKTAPCSFSGYKPQLQFEVVKENDALVLKTHIILNGTAYDIGDFARYHFLLTTGNEYFLMSFKDFQTLEWLKENKPEQYQFLPQEMAQHILARLEEDYKVNRNNLFEQNHIDVLPVNRVMLSEISGSFLVLTPQWMYEGFLIEGPWKETYEITKAGEAYVIQRNRAAEKEFSKLLEGLHPNFVKQLNGYYYLSFAEAQKKQWFLRAYHFLLEQDIQVVGMDMLQHFRYSTHKADTKVDIIENENNTLTVKLSLHFGKEEVALADLQKMLLAGQRAILLKDGSLGILGDEWIQQYGTIIKHGRVSKKEISVAKWMAITEEKSADESQVLKPVIKRGLVAEMAAMATTLIRYLTKCHPGIAATLRPYQHKGFEWMVIAVRGRCRCLLSR